MKKAVITTNIAPVMIKPSFDCELSDEGLHGMSVDIIAEHGDWYLADMPYRYKGYIHKSSLNLDDEIVESWINGKHYTVSGFSADILSEPKVQGTFVHNLTRGCLINKLSENEDEEGFVMVGLAGGQTGYMRSKFISETVDSFGFENEINSDDENAFRTKLLKTAELYYGAPYRWGGKSIWGIDCSGLCSIAYWLNGVTIFRDAAIKNGFPIKPINRDELKCGDLIFFPGHVAMYADGGRYIHSSLGNDGVYYNSLNKDDSDYRNDLAEQITAFGSIFPIRTR